MDTPANPQSFKNDHVTVQLTKEPHCVVTLEIQVTPEQVQAGQKTAIKEVNREVTIPGFRKGKAPESLIRDRFRDAIKQEWENAVLNKAFKEAMELTKVYPLNNEVRIETKVVSFDEAAGAVFTAKYECFPAIPEVDIDSFNVHAMEPKLITDEEVEKYISNLRYRVAEMAEVTDRPAQAHDQVTFDVEVLKAEGTDHFNNEVVVLSSESDHPVLQALIGQSIGSSVEIADPEAKDKPDQKIRMTVRKIEGPQLTEMDEAFFQKVHAKDLEELRHRTRQQLEQEAKQQAREGMHNQIEEQLEERYAFDVPFSLLLLEFKNKELVDAITSGGVDSARKMCCHQILCEQIARKQNIEISNEEVTQAYYQYAIAASMRGIQISDEKQAKMMVDIAYRKLIADKVLDLLVSKAKKA